MTIFHLFSNIIVVFRLIVGLKIYLDKMLEFEYSEFFIFMFSYNQDKRARYDDAAGKCQIFQA